MYLFQSAIFYLKRKPFMSIVLCITIFLSILFPATFISSMIFSEELYSTLHENANACENISSRNYISRDILNEIKNKISSIKSITNSSSKHNMSAVINGRILSSTIIGYNIEYVKQISEQLIQGKWFEDDDSGEDYRCVINRRLMYDGEKILIIGDTIQILGRDFIITGVVKGVDSPIIEIYIPNSTYDKIIGAVDSRNILIVEFTNNETRLTDIPKLSDFLTQKGIEFTNRSYVEMEKELEKNGSLMQLKELLILSVIIPYALISLINIIDCRNEDEKRHNAIYLMLGSKKRQIYLKCFYEFLILTVIAIIFTVIFIAILEAINNMNGYNSYKINLTSITLTSAFSCLITFTISVISFFKLRKFSALEIFKN